MPILSQYSRRPGTAGAAAGPLDQSGRLPPAQLPATIDARLQILGGPSSVLDGQHIPPRELVINETTGRLEYGNLNGNGGRTDPLADLWSVDWTDRILYDNGGQVMLDWQQGQMRDNIDLYSLSIDWNARSLRDNNGIEALNWGIRTAYSSEGVDAISWENRMLLDGAGNISSYWGSRTLVDSLGSSTLDWENGHLVSAYDGIPILDWKSSQRVLLIGNESAPVAATGTRTTNAVNGGTTTPAADSASELTLNLNHTGTIANHTVSLQQWLDTAPDGARITIFARSAITALTVTAVGYTFIGTAATTLAAGQSIEYVKVGSSRFEFGTPGQVLRLR